MSLSRDAESTLTIKQAETLWRRWRVENADGTVRDLAADGYTSGTLQIRDDYVSNGGEILLTLTTDNGGVVISYEADSDGQYWSGYITASAATTGALTPWGEGVWELQVSDGVNVFEVRSGVAVLKPTAIGGS